MLLTRRFPSQMAWAASQPSNRSLVIRAEPHVTPKEVAEGRCPCSIFCSLRKDARMGRMQHSLIFEYDSLKLCSWNGPAKSPRSKVGNIFSYELEVIAPAVPLQVFVALMQRESHSNYHDGCFSSGRV